MAVAILSNSYILFDNFNLLMKGRVVNMKMFISGMNTMGKSELMGRKIGDHWEVCYRDKKIIPIDNPGRICISLKECNDKIKMGIRVR